jgi:ABC-type oligopeptide transport system substrate-binding subunit
VLRELGFRTHVRIFSDLGSGEENAARNPRLRPQIGIDGWIADSPEPAPFLRALIGCGNAANLSRFCDHRIDAAIDQAAAAGPDADWTRIERAIARRAPLVPLSSRRTVVVTSRRTGDIQFDPVFGVLLDKAWVR